jgi:hypothetical protein
MGGFGSVLGFDLLKTVGWIFRGDLVPLLIKAFTPLMKRMLREKLAAVRLSQIDPDQRHYHFTEQIVGVSISTVIFSSVFVAFILYLVIKEVEPSFDLYACITLILKFLYFWILDFAAYFGVREIYLSGNFKEIEKVLDEKNIDELLDMDYAWKEMVEKEKDGRDNG